MAYERDLGITTDWSDALRTGNPIRSDLVTQYMTFTREEQKQSGVAAMQAPAVLPSPLHTIVSSLRARLQCTSDPYTRVALARDLALLTVAFETTKRGDELSRTLIQRILRLPNLSGFLFNFQRGKTMRDGTDHLFISVAYNHECLATCPVTAVEQLIAVGSAIGWDMIRGYVFPSISRDVEGGAPIRGKAPMSAAEMAHALKSHARAAGEKADFSMHSFCSDGGNHEGPESGGPLLHHGEGLLEEAQYGMGVHEDHGSSATRRGRKRSGERGPWRSSTGKSTSSR